ncbi:hypothetical protein T02_13390 [Trichinella nativa]|uniref:Uncharacterized protein n=1 Tax=Trichinella nativa TaxID=6335 RepID=A0A0V1KH86_9BILA|nr:hypothetical protein T02_13390 [Trichinella nativa]
MSEEPVGMQNALRKTLNCLQSDISKSTKTAKLY